MENFNWTNLIAAANMILALLVAFGGIVPIIAAIKNALNLNPRWSQFLAVTVCVIYTILSMIVQGLIAPESFTVANAGVMFVAILTASQAEYQRIKRANAPPAPNGA